jgi:signal transduction histidine kinase
VRKTWSIAICVAVAVIAASAATPQNTLTSIAQLEAAVSTNGQSIEWFRVEGVVCAVVPQRNMIVLQDDSAAALVQLPAIGNPPAIGDGLAIAGDNCLIARKQFGVQIGPEPVVDNDGDHPPLLATGRVFLSAGLQPIRLGWFNAGGELDLRVEYEGPGIHRQIIPNAALRRIADGSTDLSKSEPGLNYAACLGADWTCVGDGARFSPVKKGIATNFDLSYRARDQQTGLVFSGYLDVRRAGLYTFYVRSEDGSQLSAGDARDSVQVIPLPRKSAPRIGKVDLAALARLNHSWVQCDGVVEFCGEKHGGWELEMNWRGERIHATVVEASTVPLANLLHRRIRVTGICQTWPFPEQAGAFRMIVPTAREIEMIETPNGGRQRDSLENTLLTTAEQVLRLKPAEAGGGARARVRGVVTWASPLYMIMQDATAGIFIHYRSPNGNNCPHVGEVWEIEGTTDPGDFAPVIYARSARWLGTAVLPTPIQPTWDQLNNGSLDAQYVEIHGVVTGFASAGMTLLTQDGKIQVDTDTADLPLWRACLDDVVRVRGCLFADRDSLTHHVRGGKIRLGAAAICVEETCPQDPFSLPAKSAADLLLFDPRASALQRTKVQGQIIYARPHEYYLLDGHTGLRVLTRIAAAVQSGDLVEAVGFANVAGAIPVLREAQVRKVGQAAMPGANELSAADLVDRKHDSTLIRVEATVLNDTVNRGHRVLELQAGPHHFLARLNPEQRNWEFIAAGSRLRLTGVYSATPGDQADPNLDSFELLLNDSTAISVIEQGPWWTAKRVVAVVLALVSGLVCAWIWIALLRRKVEERTAQLQKQIQERQIVEHHRAMEQERTRVAQDLHDELGAGLTAVSILGSLAKNPSVAADKREHYLDQLTDSARSLITALDEIVWAVNPHYDSVASLASYYALFAQRFLDLAGIACRLQIPERFAQIPLDSKRRHGIFLAFKEALNNVVRHSGATQVRLEIQVANGQLLISLGDNGRGFEINGEAPGSDGLAGMQSRMRKLGGQCCIQSRRGEGTLVQFHLPLKGLSDDQSRNC